MDLFGSQFLCIYFEWFQYMNEIVVFNILELFREELIEERKKRPIIGSRYSLKGWWEGCLFTCQLCSTTFPSQQILENHLSNRHQISGNELITGRFGMESKVDLKPHSTLGCKPISFTNHTRMQSSINWPNKS